MAGEACLVTTDAAEVAKRPVSIYIADDLREWLERRARGQQRTRNGQIVHILEQARDAEGGNSVGKCQ